MSNKPGRNEPCHCGSGKKYKKCCMPKDLAKEKEDLLAAIEEVDDQEVEGFADADEESGTEEPFEVFHETMQQLISGNDSDDPKPGEQIRDDYPEIPEADEHLVDEWWDEFRTIEDPVEERKAVEQFMKDHPSLVVHLGLHHEVLFELARDYLRMGRIDEHIEFLMRIRKEFPETYLKSFGYYDASIIYWLIWKGRPDEIPAFLNLFVEYPVDFPERLFDVISALQATNHQKELMPLIKNTYIYVLGSDEIFGGNDIISPMMTDLYSEFISAEFSDADFETLTERLRTLGLQFDDEIFTKSYWDSLFEKILKPYHSWELPTSTSKASIRDFYYDLSLNFIGYLKENLAISWVSANYYAVMIMEYFHTLQRKKGKKEGLLNFSKKTMDSILMEVSRDFVFIRGIKGFSLLNSIFYFAEFLEICGLTDQKNKEEIQNSCESLFAMVYKIVTDESVEALMFKKFPIFDSPGPDRSLR